MQHFRDCLRRAERRVQPRDVVFYEYGAVLLLEPYSRLTRGFHAAFISYGRS